MFIRWEYGKGTILIHTRTNFVKLCAVLITEGKMSKERAGRFHMIGKCFIFLSHSRRPLTCRLAHGKVG